MAELAREVWNDPALAERLERDAGELHHRFNGGVLGRWLLRAQARPRQAPDPTRSRRTWATCCGAESFEQRVEQVASLLMSDRLWSGLGVRGRGRGRVQPALVHNGTVWPHDNS
jgi:glycogen debranching enzyme